MILTWDCPFEQIIIMSNSHPLELVGRVSEAQLQVGENLDK